MTDNSAQMPDELKPCPFCRGEAERKNFDDEDFMHEIICSDCDLTMMASAINGDLTEHWNTRTPDTTALLEAAKPMLKYMEEMVDGWQHDPLNERHPSPLGVTLKTNCGTVYAIVDAYRALRNPNDRNSS